MITFRQTFRKYLSGKKDAIKLQTYQKIGIGMLVFVLAGFVGWLWEFLFTFFRMGATEIYAKGGNLLPWINIYAIGAIVVILLTYKFRKHPWAVALIAFASTYIVELLGGILSEQIYHARYWYYSGGLWDIGNIGGYVCCLSATAFAIGSLLLMYAVFPFCIHLALKMKKRAFLALAITLFTLVMADEITNLTLKNLGLPTAMDFYRHLGLHYPTDHPSSSSTTY